MGFLVEGGDFGHGSAVYLVGGCGFKGCCDAFGDFAGCAC